MRHTASFSRRFTNSTLILSMTPTNIIIISHPAPFRLKNVLYMYQIRPFSAWVNIWFSDLLSIHERKSTLKFFLLCGHFLLKCDLNFNFIRLALDVFKIFYEFRGPFVSHLFIYHVLHYITVPYNLVYINKFCETARLIQS